jgi:Holliday junction resolvase RusA-like endonuclease
MPGDLDNLAKTFMDAAQLHKNEEPGAELWTNDRQVVSLSVDWIPTEDEEFCSQTVLRVQYSKGDR